MAGTLANLTWSVSSQFLKTSEITSRSALKQFIPKNLKFHNIRLPVIHRYISWKFENVVKIKILKENNELCQNLKLRII